MLGVILNGQERLVREGVSILEAARSAGVEIPSLCFHRGLKPSGACRLCVVEVEGWESYAAACTTEVAQGMRVQTHSEGVEAMRQTVLELLARAYPGAARERLREKPFQRLLRRYGIPLRAGGEEPLPCGSAGGNVAFRDDTHPYVRADLTSCIGCFGCVRACEEIQGQFVWRVWKRGQQTRVEPVRETLLASGCVGCGACVDACPTGALEDVGGLEPDGAAEWTRTVCPYCGVGCELEVGTRRGRIVQIQPAGDAPVNRGHLCVKGRYAFGFVHAPDRVTRPMVREAGRWKEVAWEEALGLVASRLKVAIGTLEGRCRVGVLASARATNEENYLIQKFARVVLGTNNVDCCARVCHAPTAAAMREMLGTGAATNAFEDIEEAEAFLLVGCNPTENHPVVGARIKQRVLQGAALVVLDPREIELARYGGVHLPVRPGCNLPVLHAMAHVIVAEGLVDERAIAERVAEWDAYRAFVAEWTPEHAAALSGVSAGGIREAARIYARAKPAMIFHGLGVTEHGQGTGGVMAVVNLALLTGNFGIRGSGIHPLRGQNNVQGAAHMGCDPGYLPGGLSLEEGRGALEELWESPIPRERGKHLLEMMDAAREGKWDALWAVGYDIALTNPDTLRTREALGTIPFVVVQDLFLNELARDFGHVFLPVCSSFEKDGTFMNAERRVQRVRAALAPVGDARSDWQVVCALAQAMGRSRGFTFESSEAIWEEIRRAWKGGAGIDYARLESGGLQWPCPTATHPGTAVLHQAGFSHGRRAVLARVEFEPSPERCGEEYPFLLSTGRSLYQFNAGTMTLRTSNRHLRPVDTLDMAPGDSMRLGLAEGEPVRIQSRHGEVVLRLRLDEGMQEGQLFATFQTPEAALNRLTGPVRDGAVGTPEYKVVAVRVGKVGSAEWREGVGEAAGSLGG